LASAERNYPKREAFGVYVHWPFCLSKCPYCDFNSHVRHQPVDQERFAAAFAAELATMRVRTGPRDPQLRRARSCYDHLAGDLAVKMFDRFIERRLLARRDDELRVTREGQNFFTCAGIDVDALDSGRRPLCRPCLDWSERRSHLGGTLGAAILDHVVARRWAVRDAKSRVVRFSATGEQKMAAWFSR